MFFNPGTTYNYFNELKINNEEVDDNTSENNEQESVPTDRAMGEDNNSNDLEDFTEDEFDDDEPNADNGAEEDTDNDNSSKTSNDNDSNDKDDSSPEDMDDQDDDDDNDLEDFTTDDFDDEDTDEDNSNDSDDNESGEASDSNDKNDDADDKETSSNEDVSDSDEDSDDRSLKSMEKNLFADLTPQQLAIKNGELLQNYIDLYDAIDEIFNDINKIPKTYNNTRALEFIATQVIELRDTVNVIINTTYSTKTYVENLTTYQHCLLILQQINTMLKALVQKPTK